MLGTIPTETLLQAYEYQKANDEEKKQIIDKAIERKRLKKKKTRRKKLFKRCDMLSIYISIWYY